MVRLLALAVLPILVLGGDMKLPAPTYSGRLPVGVDSGFAARLDSTRSQYLMSSRGGMLVAFAFEQGNFVPRCSLPLPAPVAAPDGGSPMSTGSIAVAGDVDGDGLDEIVVVGNRTLRKYELVRNAFALTAEANLRPGSNAAPAWCFDVCIGDVNQDGINEVLLSGIQSLPPFNPDRVERRVTLYVCHWAGKDLVRLWSDNGKLGLNGPSWVTPISRMVGVCDPANSGRPRLLVEEGKSDVRASTFDELSWTPYGLRHEGHFIIRDGRIQRNVRDGQPANSADWCDFARFGDATATLAGIVQEDGVWQGELFTFGRESAIQNRVLWSDSDIDWWSPSSGIIIDLDGNGTGALRFAYPRSDGGNPRFEFYRL